MPRGTKVAKKSTSFRSLGFASYADYLKSDHWKAFRKRYMKSGRPRLCLACGHGRIQLHHLTYNRIGNERLEDLIPLCGDCHRKVHAFHDESGTPLHQYQAAITFLTGVPVKANPVVPKTPSPPKEAKKKKRKGPSDYEMAYREDRKKRDKEWAALARAKKATKNALQAGSSQGQKKKKKAKPKKKASNQNIQKHGTPCRSENLDRPLAAKTTGSIRERINRMRANEAA
jgi:hypothetical protein